MAVEAASKEQCAISYFEGKLAFETGPIDLSYAMKENKPLQIIDLRGPEHFAKGHVPGAINITLDQLEANLPKLSKEKTAIVYCYNITCQLSTKAALLLAKKGYPVKELDGGFEEWVKYELPVEGKAQAGSCGTSKHSCSG